MPSRTNGTFAWQLVAAFVIVSASAARAAAQTVVVGTGNPDIDVPAVQAAVDQGGEVVLEGHFSFNRPPTIVLPAIFQNAGYPSAMVLVSKQVAIFGVRDDNGATWGDDGEMTSIDGGTIPFLCPSSGSLSHGSGTAVRSSVGRRNSRLCCQRFDNCFLQDRGCSPAARLQHRNRD
jgi:hypothetical protein